MCLVDLPGYGFAYAKEEVKEAWEELVSIRLALTFLIFICVTCWICWYCQKVQVSLYQFCKCTLFECSNLQVKEYVSTRLGLKRVCLLIDTKWGMKPRDHELIDLMERYKDIFK